jgi:hypothetical protein
MPRKVQGHSAYHLPRKAKGRPSFPADPFADSTEDYICLTWTKKMTNDDDALNAFSAVLTRFKESTY